LKRTIIFIYNADSNIWNKYLDFAHKILSPSTYSCDLCSLTHGNFSENKAWRQFREDVPYEFIFKYKDQFVEECNESEYEKFRFPIILEQKESVLDILVNDKELNMMSSVEDLIETLRKKLT